MMGSAPRSGISGVTVKANSLVKLGFLVFITHALTGCWVWYTDNPSYKPEVTNAYKAPPTSQVNHIGQWAAQMFDARLSVEILDGKCQKPTIYSDLEFQIRRKGEVLLRRQFEKKSFDEKVYLEKGEYEGVLISFAQQIEIANKTFLFEGKDKRLSLEIRCRE